MECCGADSHEDWTKKVNFPISTPAAVYSIPESCCLKNIEKSVCERATNNIKVGSPVDPKIVFQAGCYNKLMEAIKEYSSIIFGIGIAVLIIEILGLILSLILAFSINKGGRYKA